MFPAINELAALLREHKAWVEGDGLDARLQVHGGSWHLWTGDSQYDTDHRGSWGAGFLTRRSNTRQLARDLIEEAREQHAMSNP